MAESDCLETMATAFMIPTSPLCPVRSPLGVDILLELLAEATQLLNTSRCKTKPAASRPYPSLHLLEDGTHSIIGASRMTGLLGLSDFTNNHNINCILRRASRPGRNSTAVLPCLRWLAPGQAACQNTSPLPDGSICVGKFVIPCRRRGTWCMTSSMLARSLGSCISGASSCFCLGDCLANKSIRQGAICFFLLLRISS